MRNRITTGLAAIVLGLSGMSNSGCEKNYCSDENCVEAQNQPTLLTARPLSVRSEIPYQDVDQLYAVVDNGSKVLVFIESNGTGRMLAAEALLQAEIDDGDQEKVTFYGKYVKFPYGESQRDAFQAERLEINGYKISF